MKIIDLLNKIANGEEVPKMIRIPGWVYKFKWVDYKDNYYDESEDIDLMSALSMSADELNNEVEILDEPKEDKIEKLDQTLNRFDIGDDYYRYIMENRFKINELIDKLNKEE